MRGKGGEQALRGFEQVDMLVDRVAHIAILFVGAGEQLDGQDIGIAVDDASH